MHFYSGFNIFFLDFCKPICKPICMSNLIFSLFLSKILDIFKYYLIAIYGFIRPDLRPSGSHICVSSALMERHVPSRHYSPSVYLIALIRLIFRHLRPFSPRCPSILQPHDLKIQPNTKKAAQKPPKIKPKFNQMYFSFYFTIYLNI